ncbi:MAG: hypothetical protein JNJ73_17625 [Hyphomonadaceae bacterium]|nr:hypothetical protein [Hyphomonadaceae bacterium]
MARLGKVETSSAGGMSWRFDRGQGVLGAALAYGIFAPIVGFFLVQYATQLIAPPAGEGRNWVLLFPVSLLGFFAVVLLAGVPAVLMMWFDPRPYLVLDDEGVRMRETSDLFRYLQLRRARWGDIEDIRLTPDLYQIEVRQKHVSGVESFNIQPQLVGAEAAAMIETLRAEWRRRAGRREAAETIAPVRPALETQEWRVSTLYAKSTLLIAPIALIAFSVFIFSAASPLLQQLRERVTVETLLFLSLFLILPLYGFLHFLKLAISCAASFRDDRPRLVLDLEGLHERAFSYRAMGFTVRTARWSEIEDVELRMTRRRYPNKVRIRVAHAGGGVSRWTIDPYGLLGESRDRLFGIIDRTWRERTHRAPRAGAQTTA